MTTPKVSSISHDGCSPHGGYPVGSREWVAEREADSRIQSMQDRASEARPTNTGIPHGPDRYVIAPRFKNGEPLGGKLACIIERCGIDGAFIVEFGDGHQAAAFSYELRNVTA